MTAAFGRALPTQIQIGGSAAQPSLQPRHTTGLSHPTTPNEQRRHRIHAAPRSGIAGQEPHCHQRGRGARPSRRSIQAPPAPIQRPPRSPAPPGRRARKSRSELQRPSSSRQKLPRREGATIPFEWLERHIYLWLFAHDCLYELSSHPKIKSIRLHQVHTLRLLWLQISFMDFSRRVQV